MPNKKPRLVYFFLETLVPHPAHLFRSSYALPDTLPTTPLKSSENATATIQPLAVNPPTESAGIYTPTVKDPADVKSPQLPFGENVAVATGVVGGP